MQITQLRHARKSLQNLQMQMMPFNQMKAIMLSEKCKKIHNLNIDIESYQEQIDELEHARVEYQIELDKAQDIFTQNSSEKIDGERLAEIKSNYLPNCISDIATLEEQLAQHAKTSYLGIIDKFAIKTIDKLSSKERH